MTESFAENRRFRPGHPTDAARRASHHHVRHPQLHLAGGGIPGLPRPRGRRLGPRLSPVHPVGGIAALRNAGGEEHADKGGDVVVHVAELPLARGPGSHKLPIAEEPQGSDEVGADLGTSLHQAGAGECHVIWGYLEVRVGGNSTFE